MHGVGSECHPRSCNICANTSIAEANAAVHLLNVFIANIFLNVPFERISRHLPIYLLTVFCVKKSYIF